MTKYDNAEFVRRLRTLPFPVAHEVFLKPQTAPYLIYTDNEFEIIAAQSENVLMKTVISLELYTKNTQTEENETIVEEFLDGFTTYEKARSFITEEKVFMTRYTFML